MKEGQKSRYMFDKVKFSYIRLGRLFDRKRHCNLPHTAVTTFLLIAERAHIGSGYSNVVIQEIADDVGKDKRNIIRDIHLLQDCALLVKVSRGTYMCEPDILFCGTSRKMKIAQRIFETKWQAWFENRNKEGQDDV